MASEINSFIKTEFTNAINYCLKKSEIKNYYNKHDKSEPISRQSARLGEEISSFLMKKIIKKITTHEDINVDIASNVKTKNRKRSTSSNLPHHAGSKNSSGHKKSASPSSSSQKKFKYCYTDSDDSSSSPKRNSFDDEESPKNDEKIEKKKKRSRTFIPRDIKMKVLKLVNKYPYMKLPDIHLSTGYNSITSQQINMWKNQFDYIDSSDESNNIDNRRIINVDVYNKCVEQSNINCKFNERQLKLWALEAKEIHFKNDLTFQFVPDDKWLDTFKIDYSIIEAGNNEMYVIPKKLTEQELRGYMEPCDVEIDLVEEVENVDQVNNDSKQEEKITLKPNNIVGINMNNIEMINMNKQKILREENFAQILSNVDDFIDEDNVDPLQTVDVDNHLINEVPESEINENALNIYTYSKCQEFSEKKIKFGDKEIREWAIDAAKLCALPSSECSDFKPSDDWINKFKKTNGIVGEPWDLRVVENVIDNSEKSYDSNQNLLDLQMNDTDDDDDFFKSLETPSCSFTNLNIEKDNNKVKNNCDQANKLADINGNCLDLSTKKNSSSLDKNKNNKVELVDLTIDDDDDNSFAWRNGAFNIKTELLN
ncbi:hypothetical protein HCN44_010878 [Aphidius gifuensis]|uniref:Uncharacterized protein n=1 Tax=Aphidius gifuensis TaxID=684658 RepID=A0A834XIB8_APHGI|nr:uncharacterized protein LOC122860040 [Aphidius gifuensis]KAF7987210.1 hypothetical protein HCN44_010878 [Aphidius gifuensis]